MIGGWNTLVIRGEVGGRVLIQDNAGLIVIMIIKIIILQVVVSLNSTIAEEVFVVNNSVNGIINNTVLEVIIIIEVAFSLWSKCALSVITTSSYCNAHIVYFVRLWPPVGSGSESLQLWPKFGVEMER